MTSRRLSLCLIETAPAGLKGSMARYADLLETSLQDAAADSEIAVTRVNLALSEQMLAKIPSRLRMWIHHGWIMLATPLQLWGNKADIYHVLDGSHGYVARFLPATKTVVTAHDIIPLMQIKGRLGGGVPGKGSRFVINASIKGLQGSSMLVCDSTSTMHDLRAYAGIQAERLTVVFPALSGDITSGVSSLPGWSARRHRGSAFILHLGHNGFYKNRYGVLRVFSMLYTALPDVKLKLAGPPLDEKLLALAEQLGIHDRIECIVNPDDAQVSDLYRHASLLLFPSIYEGFGWPPLEAMALGCPVVCSSEGSLPEVVGDAALTAAASDEATLAEHCLNILQHDEVAEDMIRKGHQRVLNFQPQQMAGELINVYRRVEGP